MDDIQARDNGWYKVQSQTTRGDYYYSVNTHIASDFVHVLREEMAHLVYTKLL